MEKLTPILKPFRYIVLVIIAIFIFFSIIDIIKSKPKINNERIHFYQKGFSGIVKSKSLNRGFSIRLFNEGKIEKTYLYSSKNFDLNPPDLYDFIKLNDSIVKLSGSLNLYIYRNNEKYYFHLGEYINNPSDK
jgi:hypothetical protein